MKISEMTNEQLKKEYEGVQETVEVVGCYGTKDLMWMHALEKEIYDRGGEIFTRREVSLEDDEEDDE